MRVAGTLRHLLHTRVTSGAQLLPNECSDAREEEEEEESSPPLMRETAVVHRPKGLLMVTKVLKSTYIVSC